MAPKGINAPSLPFQSEFSGEAKLRRWLPSFLVPEVDQHLMGTVTFSAMDPMIDQPKSRRIRDLFTTIYHDMETDPDFAELSTKSFSLPKRLIQKRLKPPSGTVFLGSTNEPWKSLSNNVEIIRKHSGFRNE